MKRVRTQSPPHLVGAFIFAAGLSLGLAGCGNRNEVIVYTALDQEFAEAIFAEFTEETGITVRAKFDTEASKTVGLTNLLLAERNRPRCDVFWNNELLNTLRLKSAGVLAPCYPANAKHYPPQYRDSEGEWYGFAARARVLLVNTETVSQSAYPTSLDDLVLPKWKGRIGIAKPLFGTTATHAACLFAANGPDAARDFLKKVADNARVYPGNKQVALAVSKGEIAFGLTDTDDATVEIEAGRHVAIIYPDQQKDQIGTLFIPNSLALIKGARHAKNGKRLIEFLLRPETEQMLADGESAQIPLNTTGNTKARVETPQTIRPMNVDFSEAAKQWPDAAGFVREAFAGR